MRRGPERGLALGSLVPRGLATVVLLGCFLVGAAPGEAQLRLGAHVVGAQDSFDGTIGLGVRAGIEAPVLPFDLLASGEYFFSDCPAGITGCGLYGLTVDANFRLVFPVVRPYISGGLAYRNIDLGDSSQDDSVVGPSVGAGVDAALGNIRAFGELRYEFVDAPEKQFIWRLGLLFDVF